MTVSSTISKVSYSGDDSTVSFPIPFNFTANADIVAVLADADGNETTWTITTDYTLTGAGGTSGGTLTAFAAPATGETLVIYRDPEIKQLVDYVENDPFSADTHEGALDKLTYICQALDEKVGRALLQPVTSSGSNVTFAPPDAGKVLLWNATGTAVTNGPDADQITRAQGYAEDAEAARDAAEAARDSALAAAAGLSSARLDALDRGLAAEAYRRAMGDLVSARGYFLNGWIDPLADAGEVTITNGSFVSADGGYLTNAGADDYVTALDLTTAQFLDEKGSITTLTVDTANTSGHFDVAVGARVKAGCGIVISGTSYPIVSIAGDGTASNAVVFTGTLAAGAHTVSGIYGVVLDDTSLRLGADKRTTDICTGGTPVSSGYYSSNTPSNAFDDSTSTYWQSSTQGSDQWIGYTFSAMHAVYHVGLYTYSAAANNSSSVRIDYTTNGGSSWTTGSTYEISNTASSWVYIALTAPIVCNGIRIVNLTTLSARWLVEEIIVYDMDLSAVSVVYPISLAADCTDWTAITAVSVSETLSSQYIWYALSFDGGTTYSAFVSGSWLEIVQNNAGTWEYWTGSAWATASINSALGAMAQAAGIAGNQMTGATLAGLSQAQIEGSGGFVPLTQTSLPVLVALYSASSTATPVLSAMSMTADIQAHDAVFEFDAFEAVDPDTGIAVFPMEAVDTLTVGADLKAWLKRGSGAYQEITLHQGEQFDDAVFLYYGDVNMSAGTGDATQFKLTCHNHKELRVFMVENHFRSV